MVNNNIVAVAMSGGVDSSTAALLLKNQGYEVIGITGIMFNESSAADKAADVCKMLGITHYAVDLKDVFQSKVIDYFEESYKKGFTPNPCTVCNINIKWGALKEYAFNNLGAEYYATGHYARIVKENGNYKLYRAKDLRKDQIYMLFGLTQNDLARTLFPLSDFIKDEVREIAAQNNLPSAQSKESQDICFIPHPDTTQKYLSRKFGEQEGNIIDATTHKILGKHTGAFKYTIGQRKGIGIAAAEPLYVVSVDPATNSVYVGFEKDLFKSELEAINVNWQQEEFQNNEFKSLVKIRYNSKPKEAVVIPKQDNTAIIKFTEPQSAITPGQVAVFYDLNNEYLIGGGWIK